MLQRCLSSACTILLQCLLAVSLAPSAHCQANSEQHNAPASTSTNSAQNQPEVTARDETATFKVKVNLVEVRVVVRDSKGQPVPNLKREDFELLDNGKRQVISKFSEEKAGEQVVAASASGTSKPVAAASSVAPSPAAVAVPDRFISYLFDDIHIRQADLQQARSAVKQQFQLMRPNDRAAIITTSGQTQIDFTNEHAKLIDTLDRIIPRPIGKGAVTDCPSISYYEADLIQNKRDQRAILMATQDALECAFQNDQRMYNQAKALAETTAIEELNRNDTETRFALSILEKAIRRSAEMPGERIVVFASPGFLNPDQFADELKLMELALREKVIINTLDVRGLYTNVPDVSEERLPSPTIAGVVQQYDITENEQDDVILADFADATGGTFFHNNNDLVEGFRRVASAPEYSYVLAFTPENLKLDGKFHNLKVLLKPPAKGTVQARRGYYAPKGPANATEQARQDVEDAVFSREQVRDIPIDVHTQFFKTGDDEAKLSVIVRMDVRRIHFHKDNGRNNSDVTVVSALFDSNGNFVSGTEKVLQLHLKDETLEQRLGSGLVLKSSFDVKPGNYVVRLVVRGEDGQLAAENSTVEIP